MRVICNRIPFISVYFCLAIVRGVGVHFLLWFDVHLSLYQLIMPWAVLQISLMRLCDVAS